MDDLSILDRSSSGYDGVAIHADSAVTTAIDAFLSWERNVFLFHVGDLCAGESGIMNVMVYLQAGNLLLSDWTENYNLIEMIFACVLSKGFGV